MNYFQTGLWFFGFQLMSRLLTFSLNQALITLISSPQALGTASIQFEPILNSILFLSREYLRNVLSRRSLDFIQSIQQQPTSSTSIIRHQQIINSCYLPIPIGLFLSTLLFGFYSYTLPLSTYSQHHFQPALIIYYLSSLIELISEPAYLYHLLTTQTSPRIKIEATAVFLKTLFTFGFVCLGARSGKDWALLGFSLGQLTYSISLSFGLWISRHRIAQVYSDLGFTPRWKLLPKSIQSLRLLSN